MSTTLPVDSLITAIHAELRDVTGGAPASYIPPLADADPAWFGISLMTVDGFGYEVGDARQRFTIQSVSKPFVFGLCLEDRGASEMLGRVGVEPTGDPFNSISVEVATSRPHNPMVNAGAIVTASLIDGDGRDGQWERLQRGVASFAGRPLTLDERVLDAERRTGDRNRAIAYFMRGLDMLPDDVDAALDLYFRQCSLLVDARDLAMMAATLANRGVNPVTGERVIRADHVLRVLSVMSTCGMYDFAGEWVYRVGIPAKSGVSGGVMAVVPGQLGIGIFSPPLDEHGNSVRGIAACEHLSRRLGLHSYQCLTASSSAVRRSYRGDTVRSKRLRSPEQRAVLAERGAAIAVLELHGDLYFATAESLSRAIAAELQAAAMVVVDCKRVASMDTTAATVLAGVIGLVHPGGAVSVLAGVPADHPALGLLFDGAAHAGVPLHCFATIDDALEWCEDQLLDTAGLPVDVASVELAGQELLADVGGRELAALEQYLLQEKFDAGATVFEEDDAADRMYFVGSGQVSIHLRVGEQSWRLATMGPGMAFGEMAVLDGGRRSTTVRADEPTVCSVLTAEALSELERDFPTLPATLYANLARSLSRRLREANGEVRALA